MATTSSAVGADLHPSPSLQAPSAGVRGPQRERQRQRRARARGRRRARLARHETARAPWRMQQGSTGVAATSAAQVRLQRRAPPVIGCKGNAPRPCACTVATNVRTPKNNHMNCCQQRARRAATPRGWRAGRRTSSSCAEGGSEGRAARSRARARHRTPRLCGARALPAARAFVVEGRLGTPAKGGTGAMSMYKQATQKVGQLLLAVPKQHVQWTVTNGARTQVVTHGLRRRVREDTRSHRIWQGRWWRRARRRSQRTALSQRCGDEWAPARTRAQIPSHRGASKRGARKVPHTWCLHHLSTTLSCSSFFPTPHHRRDTNRAKRETHQARARVFTPPCPAGSGRIP